MGASVLRATLLLVAATFTLATTHDVAAEGSGDVPTIQELVNAAAPGDTIQLTGLYQGPGNRNVVVPIPLTFKGPATIDCEGATRGFWLQNFGSIHRDADTTTFEDLTILGAAEAAIDSDDPGGPRYLACSRCIFRANGHGLYTAGVDLRLEECLFADNGVGAGGYSSIVWISRCTFVGTKGPHLAQNDTVIADHSIFAFGGAEVLECGGYDTARRITCSDLFCNAGGDAGGACDSIPQQEDVLRLDPLFCPGEGYTLRDGSPCATAPCGQMGYAGVGCDPTVIAGRSWGSVKSGFR